MQMQEAAGSSTSRAKPSVVGWGFAVVVFILLWQARALQPYLTWLGVIIVLGLMLRYYPTIQSQFKTILEK